MGAKKGCLKETLMDLVGEFFVPHDIHGPKGIHRMWVPNPNIKLSFRLEKDAVRFFLDVLQYWHPRLRKLFCEQRFGVYPRGAEPLPENDNRCFIVECPVEERSQRIRIREQRDITDFRMGLCRQCLRVNWILRMIFESPRIFCGYPFVQNLGNGTYRVYLDAMRIFAESGHAATRRYKVKMGHTYRSLSPYDKYPTTRARWRRMMIEKLEEQRVLAG